MSVQLDSSSLVIEKKSSSTKTLVKKASAPNAKQSLLDNRSHSSNAKTSSSPSSFSEHATSIREKIFVHHSTTTRCTTNSISDKNVATSFYLEWLSASFNDFSSNSKLRHDNHVRYSGFGS